MSPLAFVSVIDATAKIPSGILEMKLHWPGDYQLCENVFGEYVGPYTNLKPFTGRYCRVDVGFAPSEVKRKTSQRHSSCLGVFGVKRTNYVIPCFVNTFREFSTPPNKRIFMVSHAEKLTMIDDTLNNFLKWVSKSKEFL